MTLPFSNTSSNQQPINAKELNKALDHVWTLINERQVKQAIKACNAFTRIYKSNADGWYADSFLAFQLKNFQLAIESINQSIKIQPNNSQWQLHKAHCLLMSGNANQAQMIIDKLVEHAHTKSEYVDVDFCAELALILNKLSKFDQAEQIYQQAITLLTTTNADSINRKAQLCFNLASIQRYLGKLDAAEKTLSLVIELNKYDYEAYLLRSSLRKQSHNKNHIAELTKLLKTGINHPIGKAQICYALAKENEDLAHYQQSFVDLNLAASTRRQNMRYDISQDLATIEKITETFDQTLFAGAKIDQQPGYKNNEAIFILGLPRTGSTLIERIVSNHTEVHSAGELNNFALQMMAQVKSYVTATSLSAPTSKSDLVALTPLLDFAKLGQDYIESTRPDTGHTKHFIDKLPLNSLYVGLIHLALPQAKLIHVKRHPLDTCYAIYKQLFTHGYPFSYDLNELAQYYIAHHYLMQHWQKLLPNSIYQVAYEDVVSDVENQAKSLLSFCELPWQAQCIDFQKNQAASTTASATQVRQGIYQSSKGKWRHYQEQLAPLKAQLEQAGICCD